MGRIVDLSKAAAEEIDSILDGVVPVTLTVVSLGDDVYRAEKRADAAGDAARPRAFSVQAGAFANAENAERLRDRLAERFPNSYLEEFQGLRRVKLGPFDTREAAEVARRTLGELGIAGIVVEAD